MTRRLLKSRGFTLIEVVVIIAILAVMLFVIGNTLAIMVRSFNDVGRSRVLIASASAGLERLAREVRDATAINAGSVLGVDPSTLTLDTTDGEGSPTTVSFRLNNGTLLVEQAGVTASLTPSYITVDSFVVKQVTTDVSQAIKVDLTASDNTGTPLEILLHDTIILRGSY